MSLVRIQSPGAIRCNCPVALLDHKTSIIVINIDVVWQKINELKQIMEELPSFTSGAYAEIRAWIKEEIGKTKTRAKVKHQDWIGVKKEGAAQIMLVGAPNIGKSSLLKALSDIQIKVANYAFTTLKPIPSIIKYEGI